MSYVDNKDLSKLEMDIKLLIDGGVEKENPIVRDALSVYFNYGDDGPINEVIKNNPGIIQIAKRNISRQNFLDYKHPFRKPTPAEVKKYALDKGSAKFGFINHYGNIFSLPWSAFLRIVIILGQIGYGKSILLKHLVLSALREVGRKWSIFISDPQKREMRNLTNICTRIVVIPASKLQINPLAPEKGESISSATHKFSTAFFSSSLYGPITRGLVEDILDDLYRERGCYDGSSNWPTFHHLHAKLTLCKKNFRGYGMGDIVDKMILRFNEFAKCKIFQCRQGLPIDYFLNHDVVVETDDLSGDIKNFLLSHIIHATYRYFVSRNVTTNSPTIIYFLEEASHLHRSPGEKEWDTLSCFVEDSKYMRAQGIGHAHFMQSPDMVHGIINSNAITKVCYPLTSGYDNKYLRETFDLEENQAKYIYRMKSYGEAVVRTASYPEPFIINVPPLDIGPNPPQDIFEQRMARHWSEIDRLVVPIQKEVIEVQPPEPIPDVQTSAILFEMTYLPFYTKTLIAKLNRFSRKQKDESIAWLLKHEYLKQQKYPTTKTNHPTYYVPQQKALKVVGKTGYGSKGGYEHSLYCYLIMNWAATHGYNYKLEGRVSGFDKSIDVLIDTADLILAYEVTLHLVNLVENITKDIHCQVDRVVIVIRNQNDLDRAMQIVESEPILEQYLDRISFQLAYEFNQS